MLDRTAPPVDDRSADAHRHFFACIGWAMVYWPYSHEFEPANAEHLRAWLACHDTVMHCECHAAAPAGLDLTEAEASAFYGGLLAASREAGGYSFLRRRADGVLELRIPRTMALKRNGGEDRQGFRVLAEKMFKVMFDEAGFDIDRLKLHARRNPRVEGQTIAG